MAYSEAVDYLKEHDIKKDDGTFYEFGEGTAMIRQTLNG
jgi:asparaginyl-tRNA synthetase